MDLNKLINKIIRKVITDSYGLSCIIFTDGSVLHLSVREIDDCGFASYIVEATYDGIE